MGEGEGAAGGSEVVLTGSLCVPASYFSLAKASKATKARGQGGSHLYSLHEVSLWETRAAWEARQ